MYTAPKMSCHSAYLQVIQWRI